MKLPAGFQFSGARPRSRWRSIALAQPCFRRFVSFLRLERMSASSLSIHADTEWGILDPKYLILQYPIRLNPEMSGFLGLIPKFNLLCGVDGMTRMVQN